MLTNTTAKMPPVLRPRPPESPNYSSDGISESAFTVESASRTTQYMKIKVIDVDEMFPGTRTDLPDEGQSLIIPEWTSGDWLQNVEIQTLQYNNKIKTLIAKIRKVHLLERMNITETLIDGFMDSLLHILCFDDYPCYLYPQYDYSAQIGPNNRSVKAKPDFSVLSNENRIMLVIEDKTITSATYSNNWKEDQVMGELFTAVHHVVTKSNTEVTYPVNVYAVRVIGTKFTFYKSIATLEYIKESAKRGFSIKDNEMKVERYPPVEDEPSMLTAYNICDRDDRMRILECLCSIRKSICL